MDLFYNILVTLFSNTIMVGSWTVMWETQRHLHLQKLLLLSSFSIFSFSFFRIKGESCDYCFYNTIFRVLNLILFRKTDTSEQPVVQYFNIHKLLVSIDYFCRKYHISFKCVRSFSKDAEKCIPIIDLSLRLSWVFKRASKLIADEIKIYCILIKLNYSQLVRVSHHLHDALLIIHLLLCWITTSNHRCLLDHTKTLIVYSCKIKQSYRIIFILSFIWLISIK